ncbi:hypothetical protein M422DRAFT_249385 [Sphaerobolus stellatus SS14]|uniref:Clp ATPase C-terminal domain-containing protein n=1 Tax=Sphaerobolus stellatus (strain SS14) TaxID=990650 RepID=A0A0C9VVH0_SPHS4|nr:hypothetical protein M422DRAFT_249385 [Sphaerobolus stellatus SS14]
MQLDYDDKAREWLAEHGYNDVYGATAIARIIRTKVVNLLAEKLLSGTIRDDNTVWRLGIIIRRRRVDKLVLRRHESDPVQRWMSSRILNRRVI